MVVVVGSRLMAGSLTRNCSLVVGHDFDRGEASDTVVGDADIREHIDTASIDIDVELATASPGIAAAAAVSLQLGQVHQLTR